MGAFRSMLKLTVIVTARLAYFWTFIGLFYLGLAMIVGKFPLSFPIGEWPYWFAAAVAVAVGKFPGLDSLLERYL